MDEDFGFVERRRLGGGGGGSVVKNEHGKLTNGNNNDKSNSGNLHPDDDDCRDATSVTGETDGVEDQSMRKLSLSSLSISEEKNNSGGVTEDGSMLKHIKTTVKSSSGGENPHNKPLSNGTSPGKSQVKTNGTVEKVPATPADDTETQLPLPQRFVVKYLGHRETSNLWGIKYTRRPVDEMVTEAKAMLAKNSDRSLPLLKLEVTESGITIGPMPQNNNPDFPNGKFPIEAISYGVQDLVYTRVFAMIVVRSGLISEDGQNQEAQESIQKQGIRLADIQKAASGAGGVSNNGEPLPFRCHAFVCDSRQTARKLTYSLAAAFHKFSKSVTAGKLPIQKPKKFAIDLRSPEDIEADLLDSEA